MTWPQHGSSHGWSPLIGPINSHCRFPLLHNEYKREWTQELWKLVMILFFWGISLIFFSLYFLCFSQIFSRKFSVLQIGRFQSIDTDYSLVDSNLIINSECFPVVNYLSQSSDWHCGFQPDFHRSASSHYSTFLLFLENIYSSSLNLSSW